MKLASLQMLRAVAACAVVLHHAQGLCDKYAIDASRLEGVIGELGRYGVDLFFVLSGFVIVRSIQSKEMSAREFLARRIVRIVPIYWVITAAFVVIALALPAVMSHPGGPVVTPLVESLFFIRYVSDTSNPILYVGWSIEYEMYFYLLATAAIVGGHSIFRTLAVALLGVYLGVNLVHSNAGSPGSVWFFLGDQIALEFLLGAFVAQQVGVGGARPLDVTLLAAVFLCVFLIDGGGRFLFAGVPAAALVWLAVRFDHRIPGGPLANGLTVLGDASYSIYLVQVMTLPFVGKLFRRFTPELPPDLLVLTGAAFTLLVGLYIYRHIERPLLAWLRLPTLAPQRA